MGYSWDNAVVGQIAGSNGLHDTYFLRAYVLTPKDHKYFATPPANDYLLQRQRGQLEGMTESLYKLNKFRSASNSSYSNASYGKIGRYDIASKLGLYHPTTSFTVDYTPGRKRNQYDTEEERYSV